MSGGSLIPKKTRDFPFKCPECGSTHILVDDERGELKCGNCGLVITDSLIDSRPEWRAFSPEEVDKKSRIGPPRSLTASDRFLSTTIGRGSKDIFGKGLSPERRARIDRLRRLQVRSSPGSRNLARAMTELKRISSQLGMPSAILESAAFVYRKALSEGITKGRSIDAVVAASLYAASRLHKSPRTLEEIAAMSRRISKKEVARVYRIILNKVPQLSVPLLEPEEYISRLATNLKLSGSVQVRALEILEDAKKLHITRGKLPIGVAAAAIYIASIEMDERRTQSEVCDAAQITEVTLRTRYKELVKKLKLAKTA
ncbi:MAG: transcription initiation factor IIB family protein [Promethearchaeota archaeon]